MELFGPRSPMPELRLVVLAVQDRLAYGPTFATAMAALFGSAESSLTLQSASSASSTVPSASVPSAPNAAASGATTATPEDQGALINDAARDLSDYQQLTASGRLGEAGQKLEALKHRLEELQRRRR